jgi:hypothetical protein
MNDKTIDAKWSGGINSLLEPSLVPESFYQWGQNIDNAGGIIHTKQGWNVIGSSVSRLPSMEPKGMTVFKDKNDRISIVIALGDEIWSCPYPFVTDFEKIADGFFGSSPVVFCRAFKSLNLKADGNTEAINAYPILIAQNGIERAKYWDGATWTSSDPTAEHPGIPIGKWMQWSGGRLWVSNGHLLHASDFADPISFFEETFVAGGGALIFEDDITGLNQTPNLQSLLVCTDFNTSVVQSNVTDRTQWGSTAGFQSVFLPGIGCAAGKSFTRQWGMTWWMSHGGWIGLDQAINTYRSSRVVYRDQEMMRSKANMADDISGIVSTSFGNYLLVGVPSGDKRNAHIWVMNQRPIDLSSVQEPSAWASTWIGLKPVEMVTTVINGQQRVFAFSREDGDEDQDFYPNVWELFTGERQDRFRDQVFQPPCALETRLLAFSQDLKQFHYAEIDIAELRGKASIQVFVASRRGGYHEILNKQLVAAEGSPNSTITSQFVTTLTGDVHIGDTTLGVVSTTGSLVAPSTVNIGGHVINYTAKTSNTFTVDPVENDFSSGAQVIQPQFGYPDGTDLISYMPQRRLLRTSEWNIQNGENYSAPVEADLTENIDRGFSLLIKWTGRLALTGIRIFTSLAPDQTMGRCEPDELTSRFLDDTGSGSVSSTLIEPNTIDSGALKSNYLRIVTPRHLEDTYRPLP